MEVQAWKTDHNNEYSMHNLLAPYSPVRFNLAVNLSSPMDNLKIKTIGAG